MSKHFNLLAHSEIQLFLREELPPKELKVLQHHYHTCLECQKYVDESEYTQTLLQEAEHHERSVPEFFQPPFSSEPQDSQEMWEWLTHKMNAPFHPPILFIFREGERVWIEEELQSKAAGVSTQALPSVLLPENQLGGENVSLVFENDPIDHSLNIGLQGGSAIIRLHMNLKVEYDNNTYEELKGEDIAIGSMWHLSAEKVDRIRQMELNYNTNRE